MRYFIPRVPKLADNCALRLKKRLPREIHPGGRYVAFETSDLRSVEVAAGTLVRGHHIAAATIGNALEFYDFLTYAFFSIQIGNAAAADLGLFNQFQSPCLAERRSS